LAEHDEMLLITKKNNFCDANALYQYHPHTNLATS